MHLGMCFARQSGEVTQIHQKEAFWLDDSFRMYLRDTTKIQSQHLDA
jgi:hypothetical protein